MNGLWCLRNNNKETNLDDFDTPPAVFHDRIKSNAPIFFFKKCSISHRLIHSESHHQFFPLRPRLTFIPNQRKQVLANISVDMLWVDVSHQNAADKTMSSLSRAKNMAAERALPYLLNHHHTFVQNTEGACGDPFSVSAFKDQHRTFDDYLHRWVR